MKVTEQVHNRKNKMKNKNKGMKDFTNNNQTSKQEKNETVATKSKRIFKISSNYKSSGTKKGNPNVEGIKKISPGSGHIKNKNVSLKKNEMKIFSLNSDGAVGRKKKHFSELKGEDLLTTKKLKTDHANNKTENVSKAKQSEKGEQSKNDIVDQDSKKCVSKDKSFFLQKSKSSKEEQSDECPKHRKGKSIDANFSNFGSKKQSKANKETSKFCKTKDFMDRSRNISPKKSECKDGRKNLKKEKETNEMIPEKNNSDLISKKKNKKSIEKEDIVISKKKIKFSNDDEERNADLSNNIGWNKGGERNKKYCSEKKEMKEKKEKNIKKEIDLNDTKKEKETKFGNSDKENVKMTFEVTNRFAILGCDWDNISSADVFYLFESYYNFEKEKKKKFDYTKSKAVKRVTIYTSKYGEKKLKYEEEHGPTFDFEHLKAKRKNKDAIYRENNFYDLINVEKATEEEKKK